MFGKIGDAAQVAIAVTLAGLVAGCGIAAKINARNDMQASKAVYKACLAQHQEDVAACEGPREAYEADLAAYRATSAGLRPGATITFEQPTDFAPPPAPPPSNGMSVIFGPNGQAHPCLPMGPMMTVCN
jgi:hypothetical protein